MPSQEQSGNRTSHGIVNQEFEEKNSITVFYVAPPLMGESFILFLKSSYRLHTLQWASWHVGRYKFDKF